MAASERKPTGFAENLLWSELRRQEPDEVARKDLYDMTITRLAEHHPSFLTLVTPVYFQRLEIAGKVTFDSRAREDICAALALPAAVMGVPQQDLARATAARKLLLLLREDESVLEKLLTDLIARAAAETKIFSQQGVRVQVTAMVAITVVELLNIYARAGGKVWFQHKDQRTFQGPVADFLGTARELLPVKAQRRSEQAFIALAAKAWRMRHKSGFTPGFSKVVDDADTLSQFVQLPTWLKSDFKQIASRFGGKNN